MNLDKDVQTAFLATYILIGLLGAIVFVTWISDYKRDEVILAAVKDNGCSTSQIEVKEKLKKYIDEYAIENL